ncbi:aminotransferase class V-fold PLP-dependent enzyme [Nocardiopsis algeriensis]|uniref:Selenocysteine lyase/cysteine desulfurase n=1 Tax=Nocardiopsis algeriensis TaxID=1478215 RepID=A0A841IMV4_9ACTN|nr:aminotransferase class V-fold PLP-dependent enzyme [Nocardiopsis algeriensis]MBB6120067.1 selenocysteine lyase/cysteine desulfurase [Nocardiopsis algeriensis]
MDDTARTRVRAARKHFSPAASYLDTATCGLLPDTAVKALRRHVRDLAEGRFSPAEADRGVERTRAAYARLVGVPTSFVAMGTHTAQFTGTVAASLPPGSQVLTAEREFSSVVHPLLARERHGVKVREVPLEHLADEVTAQTRLVAVSAVQSSDGRLAPIADLRAACTDHGARLLLDITQAAGWLPLDAGLADYTVCSTYKWLLGPRGTAFLTATGEALADLEPLAASWYASDDPWSSLYGGPLPRASGARRLDLPPVWPALAALEHSLALLEETGTAAVHEHGTALADRFRAALDLEPAGTAIVSVPAPPEAVERAAAAGVATSYRGGRLRASFHLYNTEEEADRLADLLRGA